jgi:hypothetical protein
MNGPDRTISAAEALAEGGHIFESDRGQGHLEMVDPRKRAHERRGRARARGAQVA